MSEELPKEGKKLLSTAAEAALAIEEAAKIAAEAVETARKVAKEILERTNEERKIEMLTTLDEYFNRGIDKKKFIDVNRIPLICQDISNIHADIKEIKGTMNWITRLIIGAVVLALLGMVLVKK